MADIVNLNDRLKARREEDAKYAARMELTAKSGQKRTSSIGAPHETSKLVDVVRSVSGFLRATTMPEIAVPFPLRSTAAGSMHPTDATAANRRRTTRLPRSF
jgi:hypothetical protein